MAKKREHLGLKSGLAVMGLLCLLVAGCAKPTPLEKATSLVFVKGGIGPFLVGTPLSKLINDIRCKGFQKISKDPLVYFCTENYEGPASALTYRLYFTKTNLLLYRIEAFSPDVYMAKDYNVSFRNSQLGEDHKLSDLDIETVSTFFNILFRGFSLNSLTPSKLVLQPIPYVQNFKNKNPQDLLDSDKKRVWVEQYQVIPIIKTSNSANEVLLGGIVTRTATSHSLQFGLFYESTKQTSASNGTASAMNKLSVGQNNDLSAPTQIGDFKLGMTLEQAQKACSSSTMIITYKKTTQDSVDTQILWSMLHRARVKAANADAEGSIPDIIGVIRKALEALNVYPVLRCNQTDIEGSIVDVTVTFQYSQFFLQGKVPLADTISITLPSNKSASLIKGLSLANSVSVYRGDGHVPITTILKDKEVEFSNRMRDSFTAQLNLSEDTDVLYVLPGSGKLYNEFYRVGCYHKDLCGVTRTIGLSDLYHRYDFPIPIPIPPVVETKKTVTPKVESATQPQAFIGPPWPVFQKTSTAVSKPRKKQPRLIRQTILLCK